MAEPAGEAAGIDAVRRRRGVVAVTVSLDLDMALLPVMSESVGWVGHLLAARHTRRMDEATNYTARMTEHTRERIAHCVVVAAVIMGSAVAGGAHACRSVCVCSID